MNATGVVASTADTERYRLPRLPYPDYEVHPAYGTALPPATLGQRVKALCTFGKGVVRFAPNLSQHLARQVLGALRGERRVSSKGAGAEVYTRFHADGAVALRVPAEQVAEINRLIERARSTLNERREKIGAGKRTLKDNQISLEPQTLSELYGLVERVLGESGALDAVSAYRGYRHRRILLVLQINDREDTSFWANRFKDVPVKDPATSYMHVDSVVGTQKGIMYLNDVTLENGPFSFVLGSNFKAGLFDLAVRKVNDLCGLDSPSRDARILFRALPKLLQRKASMGQDLVDDSSEADAALRAEHRFISSDGNLVLFDPASGLHRGAIINHGQRQILQIVID